MKHRHEETMESKENRDYKIGQIVVEDQVDKLNQMSIEEIREAVAKMLKGEQ